MKNRKIILIMMVMVLLVFICSFVVYGATKQVANCKKKTCEEVYGEEKVSCPADTDDPNKCCPPDKQCCTLYEDEVGTCCDKTNQACSKLAAGVFPVVYYYNVCTYTKCPDDTWVLFGDDDDARKKCCRKEEFCTEEDITENVCGNKAGEKSGVNMCSMEKCPDGYDRYEGSVNSVCCKKDYQGVNELYGTRSCRWDNCEKENEELCKGEQECKDKYNVCCVKDVTFCVHDVNGVPRCEELRVNQGADVNKEEKKATTTTEGTSIYMLRQDNKFSFDGYAYKIEPSINFTKGINISISYKDGDFSNENLIDIYKYNSEAFDWCNLQLINFSLFEITQEAKTINFNSITLSIPVSAVADVYFMNISLFNINCPEKDPFFLFPQINLTVSDVIDSLIAFKEGKISKEESIEIFSFWI